MERIYILDSGIGGLALLRDLCFLEANASIFFVADAKYFPYGEKTRETLSNIFDFHVAAARLLGFEKIVVACNTMSTVVMDEKYKIPVWHLFQGWGEHLSMYKRPLVLATSRTIESGVYQRLTYGMGVYHKATYLINAIQHGDVDGVKRCLEDIRNMVISEKIDAIILGCTHLSFIRDMFYQTMPPSVEIEDPLWHMARRIFATTGAGQVILEGVGSTDPVYNPIDAVRSIPGSEVIRGCKRSKTGLIQGIWLF
ncbi:hypothetical protein GM182_05590 [bacterium 3DAC]|jgi:glutamate racemase|nr:hypothetical protein GM182_05590 [bacterium 3DAC]